LPPLNPRAFGRKPNWRICSTAIKTGVNPTLNPGSAAFQQSRKQEAAMFMITLGSLWVLAWLGYLVLQAAIEAKASD
jgi:hypothetical protein